MFAFAPAGYGGPGRRPPAALPLCAATAAVPLCSPAALAAAGAVLLTLLLTGFALPQAEWFALPEHVEHMKEHPREFWRHFAALFLALCGLDTVSDVAGVVGKRVSRPAGRTLCVLAVKALMLHALLALALGSALSDPQLGERQVNLLPFVPADYVGQWGEIAVAVLGDLLLLSAIHRTGATTTEVRSRVDAAAGGSEDLILSIDGDAPRTARHDG